MTPSPRISPFGWTAICCVLFWSIIIAAFIHGCTKGSETINLAWSANPEEDIAGYIVHWGTSAEVRDRQHAVGDVTSTTIGGLEQGQTYYFSLTAHDTAGLSSEHSDTISYQVPMPPWISPHGWKLHYVSSHAPSEGHSAEKAFDDDPETFWHTFWELGTSPPPHEIQIELDRKQTIGGFTYLPRQDGHRNGDIADYEFLTSEDGIFWSEMAKGTFPESKDKQVVLLPPVEARYIGLRMLRAQNNAHHCAAAEIGIIEVTVLPPPPPMNVRVILQRSEDMQDWQSVEMIELPAIGKEFFRLQIETP